MYDDVIKRRNKERAKKISIYGGEDKMKYKMGYKDIYKRWKSKQKRFGYVHPGEHSEDQFKSWIDDQIEDMWDPGYKGMDPGYRNI